MCQMKELNKTLGKKTFRGMEITDLSNKDFKIMAIKMLTKVRRAMHELNENFNKQIENIR